MTRPNILIRSFEAYARGRSHHEALTALLDHFIAAFSANGLPDMAGENPARLIALLGAVGSYAMGFGDPFGEIYTTLVSGEKDGRHLAPEPVADLMVGIALAGDPVRRKVFDPACGSGRLLLAAAKADRTLTLYGADPDLTCCKMAVANLLLQSLTGEIAHMDPLNGEFFCGYRVGTVLRGGFHHPRVSEFSDRSESRVWRAIGGDGEAGEKGT
ncbi:N-6 DNA methylase [Mucilaginibacter mali]|uniref:N-6 DNA methylase n=1 Tax=Mucilaginibacter mali TaxID=2740462 RepID=A0A7D4PXH5_9SPHI|nr:N-6 DNA methylase [Mucilaginibacter mali]QKJ32463.1 N-6 DNA methylase [Mucilaginibacter mali]